MLRETARPMPMTRNRNRSATIATLAFTARKALSKVSWAARSRSWIVVVSCEVIAPMAAALPSIASRRRRSWVVKCSVRRPRPRRIESARSRSAVRALRCRSVLARSTMTGAVRSMTSALRFASSPASAESDR